MNEELHLKKSFENHLVFCKNFLSGKKITFSPKITVRSNEERKDYASKTTLDVNPSKLLHLKNLVIKALDQHKQNKNNEIKKAFTTVQEESKVGTPTIITRLFTDFNKMAPILHNNLRMFINKVRRMGYLNALSVLKPYDLKIINDKTYFEPEPILKKSKISSVSELISKQLSKAFPFFMTLFSKNKYFGVIHPYNTWKLLWDLLIFLMIVVLIFYIPLSLSFDLNLINNEIHTVIYILLLIDMFLEMNTLYFHYGTEMRNRKQIVTNYFKTYFFPDLISMISIVFPGKFVGFLNFEILFFLKILSLKKISKKITNRFQFNYKWKGIKDLLILFFVIIFIAHLAACVWYYVGSFSSQEYGSQTWIKTLKLVDKDWSVQYMSAFYWSIVTVMTVGYGDITPENSSERLVCLFVILFGGMIFPYSINSIGSIIQDIQKEKKKFE